MDALIKAWAAPAPGTYVSIPRSPSAWLLALALFFAPISEVRVTAVLSACDVLFVLAVAVGFAERLALRERLATRPLLHVGGAYILAAVILSTAYLINELERLVWPRGAPGPMGYLTTVKLTDAGTAFLEGLLTDQEMLFLIFLFNAAIMPVAIFAVRIQSLAGARFMLFAWTAGSLFGAAFAIAYCNGFVPGHWEWSWVYLRRAHGLTGHANMLGMHSLLALPAILMLARDNPFRGARALCVGCALIVWMAIDYSGSRSSAGGIFLLLGLYLIAMSTDMRARVRLLIGAALGSAMVLLTVSVVGSLIEFRSGSAFVRLTQGSYGSDSAREIINTAALSQALESPFWGVGYQVLRVSHNVYLQMVHAAGVFGLVAYLAVLALPMVLMRGNATSGESRTLSACLFAAIAAINILSWVKSNPSEFSTALFFALVTYVGVAIRTPGGFNPLLAGTDARST